MINRIVLSVVFVLGVCAVARADVASKAAYQDSNYSIFKATGISGKAIPDVSNLSVSSGVLKIHSIYISSPGTNSELRMYDNKLAGDTSNQIGVAIRTDVRGYIEFPIETKRGLVITSTATAGAFWNQPSFNIVYIRIR